MAVCLCCGITTITGDRRLLKNASFTTSLVFILERVLDGKSTNYSTENILTVVNSGYTCRKCYGLLEKHYKTECIIIQNVEKAVDVVFYGGPSVQAGTKRKLLSTEAFQNTPHPKRFVNQRLLNNPTTSNKPPELSVSE